MDKITNQDIDIFLNTILGIAYPENNRDRFDCIVTRYFGDDPNIIYVEYSSRDNQEYDFEGSTFTFDLFHNDTRSADKICDDFNEFVENVESDIELINDTFTLDNLERLEEKERIWKRQQDLDYISEVS